MDSSTVIDQKDSIQNCNFTKRKSFEQNAKMTGAVRKPSFTLTSSKPTMSSDSPKPEPILVKTRTGLMARAQPTSVERPLSPNTECNRVTTSTTIQRSRPSSSTNFSKSSSTTCQHPNSIEKTQQQCGTPTNIRTSLHPDGIVLDKSIEELELVNQSYLATALSKMFYDAVNSDMIVIAANGQEIKAHSCVLSARSAYLADQIERLDSTKSARKINLSEHSFETVKFALLHLYSGSVTVPTDITIEDLTKLSHNLHVGSLNQLCMHHLCLKYCNSFQKPCNVSTIGVLRTLPLAWRYDYTELYSRCLQWIGLHFASIFCLKEFSELKPNDLIEECYKATLQQLTPDNIISKTIECQKLLNNLPRVKWTESIICLVGRQLEDFCHYVADNYETILQSEAFLNLGKNDWLCDILEENLLAAMNHLKPDTGCKTLIQLNKLECSNEFSTGEQSQSSFQDSFTNLIMKMRKYCERYLLKEASAVIHCSSWKQMSPSLQKRIKDQAILPTDFDDNNKQLAAKPRLSSMNRSNYINSNSSPLRRSLIDSSKKVISKASTETKIQSPNTSYLQQPTRGKTAPTRHVKILK